jgi:hypothetical protein
MWRACKDEGDKTQCVRIEASSSGWSVHFPGVDVVHTTDEDGLLFAFDKGLTIALQRRQAHLFFLHGAVLEWDGRAIVLCAPSGTGKSTMAFALLQEQFSYLSDELAPIDPRTSRVHSYPHALCLKAPPPAPYRLPLETLDLGFTLHVPVDSLPMTKASSPVPVSAFFFLQRRGLESSTSPRRKLSPAAVTAHLMANALNALAHPQAGLEPAAALARAIPGYELDTTDLPQACRAVRDVLAPRDS